MEFMFCQCPVASAQEAHGSRNSRPLSYYLLYHVPHELLPNIADLQQPQRNRCIVRLNSGYLVRCTVRN